MNKNFFKIIIPSLIGLCSIILNGTICSSARDSNNCFLDEYSKTLLEPMMFITLSFFVTSVLAIIFLSVSNRAFKNWMMFSTIWLATDIVWVINSPVQSHYSFDIGPTTKESVSMWMGFFFVFASLAMLIVSKMENTSWWKKWLYGILIFVVEVVLVFALT